MTGTNTVSLINEHSHAQYWAQHSLVYSLDTEPLWLSVFNFVQDSSIQSKDYTSFSYNPRDITSIYQLCYHTNPVHRSPLYPREPTLRSSKDNLHKQEQIAIGIKDRRILLLHLL